MRLLECLEEHALVLVAQPPDVRDDRHAPSPDRGLQVQEGLQRQLVKLGRLVGQEPDLVDRERLDAVILPVIEVSPQRRLRQQGGGEGSGRG